MINITAESFTLMNPNSNTGSAWKPSSKGSSNIGKDATELKLYSYFRSSCSWRVRIALEYKEVPYKIIPIQLMTEEQFETEYKKINPMGQVPALVVDNKILLQSIAIIEYLEETYPQNPLLPKDPFQRAKVREISELIASGIQPLQNLAVLDEYSTDEHEKLKWAQLWIRKGLAALEEILRQSAGEYCVGDAITMADCCFVPQIANAHRFKVDISCFPIITRLETNLLLVPAIQRAHASKQPDCPPEMYSML